MANEPFIYHLLAAGGIAIITSHIMGYRSYTSVEIWNFSGRQNQSLYDKERSRETFVIHSLKCSLISVKLRSIIFFFFIIIISIITMIITFVML